MAETISEDNKSETAEAKKNGSFFVKALISAFIGSSFLIFVSNITIILAPGLYELIQFIDSYTILLIAGFIQYAIIAMLALCLALPKKIRTIGLIGFPVLSLIVSLVSLFL